MSKIKNILTAPFRWIRSAFWVCCDFVNFVFDTLANVDYKRMFISLACFWFFSFTIAIVTLLCAGVIFVLWNTGVHYAFDLPRISYFTSLSLIGFISTVVVLTHFIHRFIKS